MRYELRDGRLWRDGEPWFPVGVNYHPSSTGIALWRSFPEAEIATDLEAMASAGLTLVRIFVYWADLEPLAGEVAVEVLERVRRFCQLAAANRLAVMISALTVWMNGQRFFPPWLRGRNLWTDPLARERGKVAVRAIAEAGAASGAVLAYDLGDEIPHADGRSSRLSTAEVAAWQQELGDAVRAGDPGALVTQANEASAVFGHCPFGPDNGAGLDFVSIHGYPWWAPRSVGSHRDATASQFASFLTSYARAFQPVLVDEIGAYVAGPEVTAAHLRASLPSLAAAGALGAVVWSWKDIDAPGPPYDQRPTERHTGLLDRDGVARPALASVTGFAREAATVWSQAKRRAAPVGIFVGELARFEDESYLDTGSVPNLAVFHAFVLCRRAHLPAEITAAPGPHHRLIICPSPNRLTERDDEVLRGAVLAGATLLATVGDPATGVIGAELSGVEVDDFVDGRRHQCFTFAGDTYDLRWPPHARAAVLRTLDAEVLARFGDSSPAFTRSRFHAGTVWLLNAPIERLLADAGDLADCRWTGLYRGVAESAGVVAPIRVDSAELEVQLLDIGGQERTLVVNHAWGSVEATLTEGPGAGEILCISGKSSLLLETPARRPAVEVVGR